MTKVEINESEFTEANNLLRRLDKRMRQQAVEASLKKAASVVVNMAKREVPQPGYPHDKPTLKPLKETLTFELRDYADTFVAIVGGAYPAGAHAHLVHEGHQVYVPKPPFTSGADAVATGGRSDPDPFLERAADNTRGQQNQIIVSTLRQFAQSVR